MNFINKIKKKMLESELKIQKKLSKRRLKKLQEEEELDKIRQEIETTKKVTLTPEQEKIAEKKRMAAQKRNESINRSLNSAGKHTMDFLKHVGSGLAEIAEDIQEDTRESIEGTKRKRKKK